MKRLKSWVPYTHNLRTVETKLKGTYYLQYCRLEHYQTKYRYLKKATEINSGDYEAWIELAQLSELADYPGALAGMLAPRGPYCC